MQNRRRLASKLNIELLFLPPYSPNLNLIERFWKFIKKEVIYSKHYKELSSLLTLRFQVFRKCNIVPI